MKIQLNRLLLLSLILASGIACISQGNRKGNPVTEWMSKNTTEIKTLELSDHKGDLRQLDLIVGDAKLVCLGESRHDAREQFQLKHRFIKYMVEELGFSIFILEGSLPYAELINEYIGGGLGNIDEILADMPGWFLWDTEEILDVLTWMRSYNINPENDKKLQFYGIDIVAPGYGLNSVLDYLKEVDADNFKEIHELNYGQNLIEDNSWQSTFQRFSGLTDEEKMSLRASYQKLYNLVLENKSKYISLSGSKDYNWIERQAYCANEACRMFTAGSRLEMGLIRDSAMASNALWIKQHNLKEDKAIVWAHNVHITRGEFTMTGESASIKGMGYIMAQELKDDMVSIGASFNRGEFQEWDRTFPPADENSIDGEIAKLGYEYCLVNLTGRSKDETVIDWLNNDQVIIGQDFEMTCVPANSFDAIFFVERISRTIPNPESQEKFRLL